MSKSCQLPVASCQRRRGFTLTELLVVIGIILVLIGILLPVIGTMRKKGYNTDTAAQLNALRTGIEAYYSVFRAYPGPLDDRAMYGMAGLPGGITAAGGLPTMAENMVLGLLGGLSGGGYSAGQVGKGANSLNPANPKQYQVFVENWNGQLSGGQVVPGKDTVIPEFVDRYPNEALPVLYLRARKGASGIMSDGSSRDPLNGAPAIYQYDLRQIAAYTNANGPHLRSLGKDDLSENFPSKSSPVNALAYFKDPRLNVPGNHVNSTGTPRQKDGYILISAGQDRVYGTADDITNFGNFD